jgi:hypothetical protein
MSTIIMILSLAVALSFVVFVHELGHLLAARRSKVVVEEFGIGYPPRLFALWRGEGRVVIDGQEIVIPRKFKLPVELRVGSLVLYETAKDAKGRQILTGIEQVEAEEPMAASASSVGLLDAGTIYSVNAIPFGGFCKMLGEENPEFPGSLASKSKRARIFVLAAGAGMNLLTAVLFFAAASMFGAPAVADPENAVINSVAPGSPAEAAGLQPGDIVLKADDTDVLKMQDLQEYTLAHLGEPAHDDPKGSVVRGPLDGIERGRRPHRVHLYGACAGHQRLDPGRTGAPGGACRSRKAGRRCGAILP